MIRISLRMKQPRQREGKRHQKISSRVGWAKETHETPIKHKPEKKLRKRAGEVDTIEAITSRSQKPAKMVLKELPLPRVKARWTGNKTGKDPAYKSWKLSLFSVNDFREITEMREKVWFFISRFVRFLFDYILYSIRTYLFKFWNFTVYLILFYLSSINTMNSSYNG